jgi:hypothetical protein
MNRLWVVFLCFAFALLVCHFFLKYQVSAQYGYYPTSLLYELSNLLYIVQRIVDHHHERARFEVRTT